VWQGRKNGRKKKSRLNSRRVHDVGLSAFALEIHPTIIAAGQKPGQAWRYNNK